MSQSAKPRGAGLLLFHRNLVVFGVKRVRAECGAILVEVTGIGGKVEPGETYLQCAIRECIEETGVTPVIVRSPKSWVMRKTEVRDIGSSHDGALIVVYKSMPGFKQEIEIRVFASYVETAPKPVEDLRHLVFMRLDLVREIAERPTTVRSLRDRGGLVSTAGEEQLPEEGILTFVDSPEVYARHLDSAMEEHILELMARATR